MENNRAQRDALVLDNLGLAGRLSREWDGRIEGLTRDDLEQECRIALLQAAARWNPARLRFETWAWVCMERRLRHLRDDAGLVRVPAYLASLVRRACRAIAAGQPLSQAIAELQASPERRRLIRLALATRVEQLPEGL
jgi:DNA-directed RNA polymerase specialized sigma subunit